MKLKDWIIVAIIVIGYALVAFVKLGDMSAPQSFAKMSFGDREIVTFVAPQKISKIMIYTGLNRRNRTVNGDAMIHIEKSIDGREWEKFVTLKDKYINYKGESSTAYFGDGAPFSWREYDVDERAQYVRLTVFAMDVMVGEVVFFDETGTRIEFAGIQELCDEQSVVPKAPSYMNGAYSTEVEIVSTAYASLNGIEVQDRTTPPLVKWIISFGMMLFGMVPFGWRFMGAVAGILMLPVIYLIGKKIFNGGVLLPAFATILLALDFMHFSLAQMAIADSFMVLFVMLAYYFMINFYYGRKNGKLSLILSGAFIALGCMVKWTALFALLGLLVMWAVGVISEERKKILGTLVISAFALVCLPAVAYFCLYRPYAQPSVVISLLKCFECMYIRTPLVAAQNVVLMGNPVIWWIGIVTIPFALILGRKSRAGIFIVIGYLMGLLPCIFGSGYIFEYFICSIFLILSLVFVLGKLPKKSIWLGVVTAGALALFIMFYPVISGSGASVDYIKSLQWLGSWKF